MHPTSKLVVLVSLAGASALVASTSAQAAPTHAINPRAPWARAIDDALSRPLVEQWYGPAVAEAWRGIEPRWEGNLLVTRDSFDDEMIATLGLPTLPAMAYEPTPGVVYLAMDGLTLQPTCSNGDIAHSALNCSPLVPAETTFPAYTGGQAAAAFQEILNYYEPFDIVITDARPPDFLPYTMAVVGGSSLQIGAEPNVCGRANVSCDGLKRNHVSVNFPDSCSQMAETVAQETSHNWGLEHTDNPQDLLYPVLVGGGIKTFVDSCMNLEYAPEQTESVCGYIHEIYCEGGGGEQQNTYAELMAVFGPRSEDTEAPQIVQISPADGSVFSPEDSFTVTASIEDNSMMVGVRWTWLEGLPPGTDSYTRCTNHVCDQDFNPGVSFNPGDVAWDFVTLDQPPPGTYRFLVEVIDAYGNNASQEVTISVTDDGEPPDDGGLDGTAGDGGMDTETGGVSGSGSNGDANDDATGDGGADGGDGGGGCRIEPPRGSWLGLLGLLVLARRRRRA